MQATGKKPGLGAKVKGWFAGRKARKAARQGRTGATTHHAGQVIDQHVQQTTTTTTTVLEGGMQHHGQHLHGPLVANPYSQPAHGQIFVPANTAVQANTQTGALLPASSLNGPVILPTGPKVVPIATNYPAGQAGPMVIPPSGGFINNSGNPYLTQQTYGPSGVLPATTTVHQDTYVSHDHDLKADKRFEKEQKRLEKEDIKREKRIEKEEKAVAKDQERLDRQIAKDQEKLDKQLMKDQEKLAKDQQKLANTIEKDETRLANNQQKILTNNDKREAKIEDKLYQDQAKVQNDVSRDVAYHNQAQYTGAPITNTTIGTGAHGTKHVYTEETKQDAFTGQVIDHNVYHKDSRF